MASVRLAKKDQRSLSIKEDEVFRQFRRTAMQQPEQSKPSNNNLPPGGLPAVKPPSGRFILQLFLIPGLIVVGLICVFSFGSLAWVGSSSPESFLNRLDNSNPDIRWRAAHELAQVLKRPESLELASNPNFALDIAERLTSALAELEQAEDKAKKELGIKLSEIARSNLSSEEKIKQEEQAALAAWRKLRPQRDLVLFLTSSLGDFTIPVGVHVLGTIAMKDKSAEIKGLSLRRRRAVWALANLGNNMQTRYFGKGATEERKPLSADQKSKVLERLAAIATGSSERAKAAHYAYDVLTGKAPSEVDKILAMCAKSDDVFLREETAVALNFWDGPLTLPTLVLLSRDDGHGQMIRVNED
jgi:hypothetical protein